MPTGMAESSINQHENCFPMHSFARNGFFVSPEIFAGTREQWNLCEKVFTLVEDLQGLLKNTDRGELWK